MTPDKDLLIEFLTKLGLKESHSSETQDRPKEYEYMHNGTHILVGEGEGYYNFFVEFKFDVDGKAIGHGVWE